MKATDSVLRTLVDAAFEERRSWKNVRDLAWEADVGEKLAYKALLRPTSIGAVAKYPGGGFSVTDPERILVLLCARRALGEAHHTSMEAIGSLLPGFSRYAVGGSRAAVHHLGGKNTIATHAPSIVYVPDDAVLDELPAGDEALVVKASSRELSKWSEGYTSKAQTYADLFAQPGWQASEFRRALWREWFTVDDWARLEVSHG